MTQAPVNIDPRACLFCASPLGRGKAGNVSAEHVFPRWLLDELSLEKVVITPTWHDQPLGTLLNERRHTWGSLTAGRICGRCNNGWLSDLENLAKPILLELLHVRRSIEELSRAETFLVASWATKTFYTLSAAIQENRVSIEQYHQLYGDRLRLPEGVYVFAAQRPVDSRAHFTVDATWTHSGALVPVEAALVAKNSYKALLQLGELSLLVVCWPLDAEWVLSVEKGLYQLLAPQNAVLLDQSPPPAFPPEVLAALTAEEARELEYGAGLVGIRLTQSIRAIRKSDLRLPGSPYRASSS